MRALIRTAISVPFVLLCLVAFCAAGSRHEEGLVRTQILPGSSVLDLTPASQGDRLCEASTPVRISIGQGGHVGPSPILMVYAYFSGDEGMRAPGKGTTISLGEVRIRNDRGEWVDLAPLAEVNGYRGVRIAVVHGWETTVQLQIQVRMPAGRPPGNYQGVLSLAVTQQQ